MNAIIGRSSGSTFLKALLRAVLPLAFLLTGSIVLIAADSGMTRFAAKPGAAKARIEGTSTVHDWQMEGPIIGGHLEAGPDFPTKPDAAVKPGKVSVKVEAFIPVRSLKSLTKDGKPYEDKMDEVAWDKLRSDKYPRIYFRTTELTLKELPKAKDGAYVFDSTGELVVAGVTNKISMPVNITPLDDGKALHIIGNTKVKMTDFKVDPPSPTLGVLIKTGDEVKIFFDWTVEQKAPAAPATASKP
jgi:polyisoprenoid-binding protein YceI